MRRGQETLTGLLMLWLVHPAAASAQQWTARAVAGLNVQVYRPAAAGAVGQGRSLLIVLHGCAQSVDPLRDRGGLNIAAEHHGMVIAVPAVPNGGVVAGCWDYYGDQHTRQNRHNGPVLALVDALLADAALGIDPDQVYIAGLSSGGGEAAVLACLAPDVFAGAGIAAGPAAGTSIAEIGANGLDPQAVARTCTRLAGAAAPAFATQMVAVINGDRDFTVSQDYGRVDSESMAHIYAAGGPALVTAPFAVEALPGSNPRGRGTEWSDADGPRVARIEATGMGHAWPGGTGQGGEISFVAGDGVNFADYLGGWFAENNRRVAGERPLAVRLDPPAIDAAAGQIEVRGHATPAVQVATLRVTLRGADPRGPAVVPVAADGAFAHRFNNLQAEVAYTPTVEAQDAAGALTAAEGAPIVLPAPGQNAPPTVRIDAVNAGAGCLTVEGAAADDGALVALEVGVDGHVNALPAAVGPYAIEICGLVAGCYAPVVRAVDDGGLAVEVEGPLTALGAPGFVEAVEANLTDHLPRMGNYPGGYGVADETYLALFNRHGIDQPFTLYRTAEGAWYYDPAHLPGAPAPECDGEPDPDPDPDPEPPPAPMIKIQLDPPVVDGDCVVLGGLARFTPAARTLAISVNNRLYEPVLDANSHFAIRACGLAPGCYPASLIFITAAGIKDKAAWPNFGVAGPAAAAVADGTINQHLSRYAAYPAGYGVADATYVEIFHAFGLNKSFRLYQSGADGRWYINPARLPAAEAPRCR